MEKLNLNLDSELGIMEKYNISSNEWLFIKLLFLAKEEYFPDYMYRFLSLPLEIRGDLIELLQNLQNKGIVLKSYKIPKKGERFYPENVEFNKAFINTYFRASFVMGEELWNLYPMETVINGVSYSLKNIAKKYNSIEDFFAFYGKSIKYNPDKHKEVIDLLSWAINNTNFINFGISFYKSS